MSALMLNDPSVAGRLAPVFGELQSGSGTVYLVRKQQAGTYNFDGDEYAYSSWALGLHQAAANAVPTLRIFYFNDAGEALAHMDLNGGDPVLHAPIEGGEEGGGGGGGSESYDVFIISGQSNAVGYGADGQYWTDFDFEFDATPVDGVKQWGRWGSVANSIINATEPLHHNDTITNPANYLTPSAASPRQVGFGFSFGKAYKAATGRNVLLVPCARGAQPISAFARGTELYNDMVQRAQAAVNSVVGNTLAGILWHQGESDCENGNSATSFAGALSSLISDLRADLSALSLPFIIGGFVPAWVSDNDVRPPFDSSTEKATIDSALKTVAGAPNNAWVSAGIIGGDAALAPNNAVDGRYIIHFNAASQRRMGVRYFNAFSALANGLGNGTLTMPAPLLQTVPNGDAIVDVGGRTITLFDMAPMGRSRGSNARLVLNSYGSGYASISGDFPAGSFSKACWVQFTAQPALYTNIYSGSKNGVNNDAGFHHYLWTYTGNKLTATNEIGIASYDRGVQGSEPVAGVWYHLATTWDDSTSTIALYINGALIDSAALADANGPIKNAGHLSSAGRTTDSIFLGSFYNQYNTFNGVIDDIRLYGSVLSASQIQSIYAGIV